MKILIFGPPGVGKGTNSTHVKQKYNIPHISTGDIIRSEITSKTALGKAATEFLDEGQLVPDELLADMIKATVGGLDKFILDGYPRTVPQARLLSGITHIDLLLILEAPEHVLIERLLGRGRKGETEEIIKNRLVVYQSQTVPVVNYYTNSGSVFMIKKIHASAAIEVVNDSIDYAIQTLGSLQHAK